MPLTRRFLVLALLLAALPAWALETFATSELTIETAGGPHKFAIELALSDAQMEQGLMFRRSLAGRCRDAVRFQIAPDQLRSRCG